MFFGLWLQKPMQIAAANPSGRRLADALARCIELERPGAVLELGAGTGSVTRGLLRAGCPPDRIIAVESEPRLAAVLRREFPRLTVIEGDATRIAGYFPGRGERLAAVVSSLPIKWFPLEAQRAVVKPCLELLGPGGRFLQMTNAFSSPLANGTAGDCRQRDLPSLAQPAPGADLGLFTKIGTARRGRAVVNQISPIPQISSIRQYRTIWISDIHLGTRGCKADFLIDFLRYNDADTIYLVGDIIDGWRLKRSWYWPQTHNDVVQKVLRKVRKGTRVIYVPGNHDEWLRDYTLLQFGGVEVAARGRFTSPPMDAGYWCCMATYSTRSSSTRAGWRCSATTHIRLRFGSTATSISCGAAWDTSIGRCQPISSTGSRTQSQYIGSFAEAVATEANRRGVDGVVCGHIHHAEIREMNGVLYCNDGDWVESCTALVEHFDGRLELIHWIDEWMPDPLRRPLG